MQLGGRNRALQIDGRQQLLEVKVWKDIQVMVLYSHVTKRKRSYCKQFIKNTLFLIISILMITVIILIIISPSLSVLNSQIREMYVIKITHVYEGMNKRCHVLMKASVCMFELVLVCWKKSWTSQTKM